MLPCLQRRASCQKGIRTAKFEGQFDVIGSCAMLIDVAPLPPSEAMPEEQAIPAVPEPDDPAFAELESSFFKLIRGVSVPLVAHGRHKLFFYETFDRLL